MSAGWFSVNFPPSRFAIESELRSVFWRAGYGNLWLTCLRDESPYECLGSWEGKDFRIEWVPATYLLLKTAEPNERLLNAFERILGHRALAAYRNGNGQVIVEWRARRGMERLKELQDGQVRELEPLYDK